MIPAFLDPKHITSCSIAQNYITNSYFSLIDKSAKSAKSA